MSLGGGKYLPYYWTPGGEVGNTLPMHEQYWFDNGASIGYGDGEWIDEKDRKKYVFLFSKEYDDERMQRAMNLVDWDPNNYCLLGHNCQDWASAVREKYRELEEKGNNPCP